MLILWLILIAETALFGGALINTLHVYVSSAYEKFSHVPKT